MLVHSGIYCMKTFVTWPNGFEMGLPSLQTSVAGKRRMGDGGGSETAC